MINDPIKTIYITLKVVKIDILYLTSINCKCTFYGTHLIKITYLNFIAMN